MSCLLHGSVTPPLPLDGPLTLNTHLNNAERLLEGQIHGPEDLMVHSGYLYTTLHGGHVARLVGDKLENIAKFGQPCGEFIVMLQIFVFAVTCFVINNMSRCCQDRAF